MSQVKRLERRQTEDGNIQIPERNHAVPYELANLMDARNEALYQQITQQVTITFVKSDDNYWGEKTEGNQVTVEWADSPHPIACFTHELLHVRHNLAGRRKPDMYLDGEFSSEAEKQATGSKYAQMKNFLYNSLIHHRMFPEFIALGFPAEQFLADADATDFKRVENKIKELEYLKKQSRKDTTINVLLFPFFAVNSPESAALPGTEALNKRLRNLNSAAFYTLRKLLDQWKNHADMDVRRPIARLFYLCGELRAGVAYDDNVIMAGDTAQDA